MGRVPLLDHISHNTLGLAVGNRHGLVREHVEARVLEMTSTRVRQYLRMTAPAASASSSAKAERSAGTSAMLLSLAHRESLVCSAAPVRVARVDGVEWGLNAARRSVWAPVGCTCSRLVQQQSTKQLACGLQLSRRSQTARRAVKHQDGTDWDTFQQPFKPHLAYQLQRVACRHTQSLCTTSALQPFEVARPLQAVQTMDSFLRWWRGGSNGERRTINTTPLPQRYELYHRKRRNEGVSLIAACCIAFNLVMGSGFLALPAAVARCGLIFHQ